MKKICKIKAATIGLSLLASSISTSIAYAGTLYFDYNRNTLGRAETPSVFLFGEAGQMANVSNLNGFDQDVTLNAEGFFNLGLTTAEMQSGSGIQNKGFKVQSDNAIAGYFVNRSDVSTDMTYLFDESALGTNYVVASHGSGFGEGSQIAVHATVDGTTVTIDPKGAAAFSVNLNAGETYTHVGGSTDLSGSSIAADKNVAVFAGHECANVPTTAVTFCDTIISQMIPDDRLSTSYIVTASEGAAESALGYDLIKVIATVDNTEVSVGGVVVANLNAGEVHEFELPANSGQSVNTSQPALVAQYLTGGAGADTDPAMSVVPGIDTWLDDYRLATPDDAQAFDLNYASVVIDTALMASLTLDGLAVDTTGFAAVAGTIFSQGIIDLPLGLFDLEASGDFLVMLGGGSSADSYFTFGGATFAPGVSPDPDPVPEPMGLVLIGAAILGLRKYLKH